MRVVAFTAAVAAALFTWSGAVPVRAQQAQQAPKPGTAAAELPSARTIIDRHIEAIGGRKAVLAHTSTRATGSWNVPAQGMNGTFEVLAAKPNKIVLRIVLGGVGELLDGFDGTHGWSMSPMTGPALAQGKELEQKRFDADFYGELHDPARYDSIRTLEKTTFAGRPCYKLSLVRKGGGEDTEFYDVATGLKAGGIGSQETQMGTIVTTETRGDYKKFGDLLQPASITQSAMGIEQVLTFSTFEYDTVAPDSLEPPAAIKALIK